MNPGIPTRGDCGSLAELSCEKHDLARRSGRDLLLWGLDDVSSAEVVNDAALAVADDDVAEWVLALACLPLGASANDIEDVLERNPPDIGFSLVPRGNPEAMLAGALAMVRRCVAGRVAERDLARWAHAVIRHGRSEELEPLVSLHDAYDTAEYTGDTIESVDARVRAEADRLARLHPYV